MTPHTHLNERRERVKATEGDKSVVVCSESRHIPTSTWYLRHLRDTTTFKNTTQPSTHVMWQDGIIFMPTIKKMYSWTTEHV